MSPLLFSLYTEALAARVRASGLGIKINRKKISILLCADDIILIAENEDMLQEMLNIVSDYANEFSMSFSNSKCGVMEINKPEGGREEFILGNKEIKRVKQYNYLGVLFEEVGTGRAKSERIFRANQWWGRLCSMANFRANKYEVVRGIWKTVAVPGILYAMDTMSWSAEEVNKIEAIQNKVGRLGLGANRMVGTEAIRGDMGWSTFEERLFKGKLKYKIRLEKMDRNRWAKNVYLNSGTKSNWNKNCSRIAGKCGFFRRWVDNVDGGVREWVLSLLLGEENMYDERKWKGIINNNVKEHGLLKWKQGMEKKSTLKMYSEKEKPKKEIFYNGNKGSSLLFKARTNSLEINDRTYRFNGSRDRWCKMCNRGVEETLDHVIVECSAYDTARDIAISKYKGILGDNKFREIINLDDNGIGFLLGIGKEIPDLVVEISKSFLSQIWAIREKGQ